MDNHGTHDGDEVHNSELLICNDLLELILLRLDSPICLVPAAAVCKRWRRKPPVPFFLPSPSVAAIGFGGGGCGSLLLLRPRRYTLQGLTVYEPLTRRCRVIDDPPPPWEWEGEENCGDWGAYLLSGDDDEPSATLSNFMVVCTFYDDDAYAAVLLVSSHNDDNNNRWRITRVEERLEQDNLVGRVGGGTIYWATVGGIVHVFNGITMEASSSMFPDMGIWNSSQRGSHAPRLYSQSRRVRVVDCGGAARMICLAGHNVEIFARRRPRDGGEWEPEKSVELPFMPGNWTGNATIVAAGEGFIVFAPSVYSRMLFHMDLETGVVTLKVKGGIYSAGLQFPCELPWPPNLS
uniref:F-box domain-containing protein n=1 Tax=Leersia perrieri TaxID=77586 RepID=A0A0D9VUN9_9ORYZ